MSSVAVGRLLVPLLVITTSCGLAVLLLRAAFPGAWRRWLARAVGTCAGVAVAGVLGWALARALDPSSAAARWSMTITFTIFASTLMLTLSAPVWGVVAAYARVREARRRGGATPPDAGRRAFLRNATAVMPASAVASGPLGAAAALGAPAIVDVEIPSASVPTALDGFTILHITDLHLGTFVTPAQVAAVVDQVRARGITPDLIALTGDISDDVTMLPEALALLQAMGARHGVVACIGNHEIYRGRDRAEACYASAGIPLLSDRGLLVESGDARLWIAGANDPARGIDGDDGFLRRTVDRAFAACPDDVDCRILLSHRPRGFVAAQAHRATLTLSGHTHGGQAALLGRSLLAPLMPESFLLGRYTKRVDGDVDCHLYTSAGLGHWMPFRLNCPCEAALIRLRARSSTSPTS